MNECYGYERNSVTLAQAVNMAERGIAKLRDHAYHQTPSHWCLSAINTEIFFPELHKFLRLVLKSMWCVWNSPQSPLTYGKHPHDFFRRGA